jgi:lipid-binding SYLF domain-containing protein
MFVENCRETMMIGSRDPFPEGGSMQSKTRAIVVMVVIMGLMVGCSTGSVTKDEGDALFKKAQASRQEWNKVDPQLEAFAKKGYGYAFFPEITKGGLLVGGARGQGVVYEKGQHIGYADLTQMSVGFQAAVVADKGAAMSAQFVDGVAVFVRPTRGAMVEASLAGQKITYLPK